jgi:hypothetical protein
MNYVVLIQGNRLFGCLLISHQFTNALIVLLQNMYDENVRGQNLVSLIYLHLI